MYQDGTACVCWQRVQDLRYLGRQHWNTKDQACHNLAGRCHCVQHVQCPQTDETFMKMPMCTKYGMVMTSYKGLMLKQNRHIGGKLKIQVGAQNIGITSQHPQSCQQRKEITTTSATRGPPPPELCVELPALTQSRRCDERLVPVPVCAQKLSWRNQWLSCN